MPGMGTPLASSGYGLGMLLIRLHPPVSTHSKELIWLKMATVLSLRNPGPEEGEGKGPEVARVNTGSWGTGRRALGCREAGVLKALNGFWVCHPKHNQGFE